MFAEETSSALVEQFGEHYRFASSEYVDPWRTTGAA
jgi:hypothetical protein